MSAKRRRRLGPASFQFSLRDGLLAVALVAVTCALYRIHWLLAAMTAAFMIYMRVVVARERRISGSLLIPVFLLFLALGLGLALFVLRR
jgi:hypothetical protein